MMSENERTTIKKFILIKVQNVDQIMEELTSA